MVVMVVVDVVGGEVDVVAGGRGLDGRGRHRRRDRRRTVVVRRCTPRRPAPSRTRRRRDDTNDTPPVSAPSGTWSGQRRAEPVRANGVLSYDAVGGEQPVDPGVDRATQLTERGHPVAEHDVVELAHGESVAEARLGLAAEALDLEATDHVARRLAGRRDVAVDLGLGVGSILGGVVHEEGDGLVAGPPQSVQAGVDDQAGGAERIEGEHAESLERASCTGTSRRRGARRRDPNLRRNSSPRAAPTTGCRSSSWASASWRWCPGIASWKVVTSSWKRVHALGSAVLKKNVPPRPPSGEGPV